MAERDVDAENLPDRARDAVDGCPRCGALPAGVRERIAAEVVADVESTRARPVHTLPAAVWPNHRAPRATALTGPPRVGRGVDRPAVPAPPAGEPARPLHDPRLRPTREAPKAIWLAHLDYVNPGHGYTRENATRSEVIAAVDLIGTRAA